MITLDTEQIWGYLDLFDEARFQATFPYAGGIGDTLLGILTEARISATWTVVGGLSLPGSEGPEDPRFAGLPWSWRRHIRAGDQLSAPWFYAREFVVRLRDAAHYQEVGLHGGISHLSWRRPEQSEATLESELTSGIRALGELGIRPVSFTFPRTLEAHYRLLRRHGIRCYRGRGPALTEHIRHPALRFSLRVAAEWRRATPPVVMPEEKIPGLWNLPSSLLPFRISDAWNHLVPLGTRRARIRRGIEQAARTGRIFHLWLHPENLAENQTAVGVFAGAAEDICRARQAGDIEVLTMNQMVRRMEEARQESSAPVAAAGGATQ